MPVALCVQMLVVAFTKQRFEKGLRLLHFAGARKLRSSA